MHQRYPQKHTLIFLESNVPFLTIHYSDASLRMTFTYICQSNKTVSELHSIVLNNSWLFQVIIRSFNHYIYMILLTKYLFYEIRLMHLSLATDCEKYT